MRLASSNMESRSLWYDCRVDAGHPEQNQCWGMLSLGGLSGTSDKVWIWHIYGASSVGHYGYVR